MGNLLTSHHPSVSEVQGDEDSSLDISEIQGVSSLDISEIQGDLDIVSNLSDRDMLKRAFYWSQNTTDGTWMAAC